jgi:hypothetical protein
MGPKLDHLFDSHEAKNSMVGRPSIFLLEQAEEQKHIADLNTVPGEVRLRFASLTECTSAIAKHWIIMAQMVSQNPHLRSSLHDLA